MKPIKLSYPNIVCITSSATFEGRAPCINYFPTTVSLSPRRNLIPPGPSKAWWARHDIALSPLTALYEVGRITNVRLVVEIQHVDVWKARVVGNTVIPWIT